MALWPLHHISGQASCPSLIYCTMKRPHFHLLGQTFLPLPAQTCISLQAVTKLQKQTREIVITWLNLQKAHQNALQGVAKGTSIRPMHPSIQKISKRATQPYHSRGPKPRVRFPTKDMKGSMSVSSLITFITSIPSFLLMNSPPVVSVKYGTQVWLESRSKNTSIFSPFIILWLRLGLL